MKINTLAKASVMVMALLSNSVLAYGATVVTATNVNTVKQNDISVISSKNGESVSRVDSLNSIFRISFTDNDYVTTKFAIVTNSNSGYVPVYSSASNKSSTIGSIPTGATVVLGKQEGDFYQIFFDEKIGYIENTYLISSKPQEKPAENNQSNQNNTPSGKYVMITSSTGLNLRQAPSTSAQVLGIIPSGAYTDLIEDSGSWLKVKYNGKIGYISSQFGKITDEKETQPASSSSNANATQVINFAMSHLGKPYIYGSTNLSVGTDCSGFTYAVFKNFGINLNRVSRDQYLNGTPVNNKKDLLPGDLVFFNTGGNTAISHVGIYIGNNQYIHCTDSKNQGVIISSLNSDYALKTYYGARRVL